MLQFPLKIFNRLWYTFKTPSSFKEDWKKYLKNQLGHAYLIGGLSVYIGVPVVIVFLLYGLWELLQYVFNDSAEAWDCLEDFCHVTMIAAAVHYVLWVLVAYQLLFLLKGVLWRVNK